MRKNLSILLYTVVILFSFAGSDLFPIAPQMSPQQEEEFFGEWLKEMDSLIKAEEKREQKLPALVAKEEKKTPKQRVAPEPTNPDALFLQPIKIISDEKNAKKQREVVAPKLSPAREKVFKQYLRELRENLGAIEKAVRSNVLGVEVKEELESSLERGAAIEKELGEIESKKLYHRTFFLPDFTALRATIKDLKNQSESAKKDLDSISKKIKRVKKERAVEEEENILMYYWNLLWGTNDTPIIPPHVVEQQKRVKPDVARLYSQDLQTLRIQLEQFSQSEYIVKEKEAKLKRRTAQEQATAQRKPEPSAYQQRLPYRQDDEGYRQFADRDWWKNYDNPYAPSRAADTPLEKTPADTAEAKTSDAEDKPKTYWEKDKKEEDKKKKAAEEEKKKKEAEEKKLQELEQKSAAELIGSAATALGTIANSFPVNYKDISFLDEQLAQVLKHQSDALHTLKLTLQAIDKKKKDDSDTVKNALKNFQNAIFTYQLAFLKLAKHGYCAADPFEIEPTGAVKTGQAAARSIWQNIIAKLPAELRKKVDADMKALFVQLSNELKEVGHTQLVALSALQRHAHHETPLSAPPAAEPAGVGEAVAGAEGAVGEAGEEEAAALPAAEPAGVGEAVAGAESAVGEAGEEEAAALPAAEPAGVGEAVAGAESAVGEAGEEEAAAPPAPEARAEEPERPAVITSGDLAQITEHLILLVRVFKTAHNTPLPLPLAQIARMDREAIEQILLRAQLLAHRKYSSILKDAIDPVYRESEDRIKEQLDQLDTYLQDQRVKDFDLSKPDNAAYIKKHYDLHDRKIDALVKQEIIRHPDNLVLGQIKNLLENRTIPLAVLHNKLDHLFKQQKLMDAVQGLVSGTWKINDYAAGTAPLKIKQALYLGETLTFSQDHLERYIALSEAEKKSVNPFLFNHDMLLGHIDEIDVVSGSLQEKITGPRSVERRGDRIILRYQSDPEQEEHHERELRKLIIEFRYEDTAYGVVACPEIIAAPEARRNNRIPIALPLYLPPQSAQRVLARLREVYGEAEEEEEVGLGALFAEEADIAGLEGYDEDEDEGEAEEEDVAEVIHRGAEPVPPAPGLRRRRP